MGATIKSNHTTPIYLHMIAQKVVFIKRVLFDFANQTLNYEICFSRCRKSLWKTICVITFHMRAVFKDYMKGAEINMWKLLPPCSQKLTCPLFGKLQPILAIFLSLFIYFLNWSLCIDFPRSCCVDSLRAWLGLPLLCQLAVIWAVSPELRHSSGCVNPSLCLRSLKWGSVRLLRTAPLTGSISNSDYSGICNNHLADWITCP